MPHPSAAEDLTTTRRSVGHHCVRLRKLNWHGAYVP